MSAGIRGFGTSGVSGGGCCGTSTTQLANDCCKQGMACCQGGEGDIQDILRKLKDLAQLDPQAVIKALQQNPQFAQMLIGALGQAQGPEAVTSV